MAVAACSGTRIRRALGGVLNLVESIGSRVDWREASTQRGRMNVQGVARHGEVSNGGPEIPEACAYIRGPAAQK